MQQKYVIRDRCVLLLTLLIFSIGTYSLFANTNNNNNLFEVTTYQNQVKGVVTDSNGIPIPGVTVKIKDTSTGTFTNDEGIFLINTSPTDVLILTYIGFKTLEVSVGNSTELSFVLQEDVTSLDEVTVNAGYYTVKERERTGSISKVTSEQIELQPIVSPMEALQGRMAGVEIQQQSGIPGNTPIIRIRGRNSLRADGNYPLYIIDGVPINPNPLLGSNMYENGIDPLNTLNLSNIESIEVLKDADATSIYGSRGANGVVLITTKKGYGNNKKTKIEASLYSGLGSISKKMKLLNTEQYLALRQEGLKNDGETPNENSDYDLLLWNKNSDKDWQDILFGGSSAITDINISASGGNSTTSFRISGSYHKEGTIFPGDSKYQKLTGGLNINHQSENKKLLLNLSFNYGVNKNDLFASGGSSSFHQALSLPPNAPELYHDDGSINWEDWKYSSYDNPILPTLFKTTEGKGNNLIINTGISYKLLNGLNLKTNFGYTYLLGEFQGKSSNLYYPPEIRDGIPHSASFTETKRKSWIIEPQLVYNSKFGKLKFDGLLGFTFQQNDNESISVSGRGYPSESLMGDLTSADIVNVSDNKYIKYRYNAVFARLGINWNKKYFINITGRRDGSSRFGPENRFANFWAVGTAWIFSDETFIKNHLPLLSFGKLRGSYGTTGSDQIGDYQYLDSYDATSGPNGIYPTQLFNPNFAWEVNKKLEVALELGFLKEKVNIQMNWYRNRSSNQLVGYPLPAITGFTTVQANLPATVQNTGWELEIASTNIRSKNLQWNTSLNISFPKNKLINFPNLDQSSYANRYRVGHPLNISLLYQYNGINPETGLYQVKDVNLDGRLDMEDRVVIKNLGRKYFGGVANSFTFKRLNLRFLWDFTKQDGYAPYFTMPGYPTNMPEQVYEAWKSGEIQKISKSTAASVAYSQAYSSEFFLIDASFLRLKTLSLSYTLSPDLFREANFQSLRLFVQAQNLFTITNYYGLNVEFPGGSATPSLRTITCGIQATL